MHPALTKTILEEEFAAFTGNTILLQERGILVLKATPPELRVAVRHTRTATLHVFQFLFEQWDDEPPKFTVLNACTGDVLPGNQWPKNGPNQSYWHPTGWIAPSGITLPMPFLCMRGCREYHTHKSHITDEWKNYRGKQEFTLANLVLKVANLFQESYV